MSRLFNGTTGLMTYGPAGTPAMNDALSLVMVVKIAAGEGDNTWMSFMEFNRGDATNACGLLRKPDGATGELAFLNATGTSDGTVALDDSDGWMLIAATRSTAAATTLYKIPIGGSTTTSAGGALADSVTWQQGSPTLTIGGPEDAANMYWAAGAYWDGVTLTQGQIEGIATAKTTASINALTPTWLADDSDAFATNLTNPGVGDRTASVGTADDADDPSGWVYGLSGGTDYTGTVPAATAATASGPTPGVTTVVRPYVAVTIS